MCHFHDTAAKTLRKPVPDFPRADNAEHRRQQKGRAAGSVRLKPPVQSLCIQAGAARMLLERAPDQARAALQEVESSSRLAVTEMRSLLGALRGAAGQDDSDSRAPEPTLAQLPELLYQFRATGLQVELAYVEQHPNALTKVPLPLQLSVYQIVSEALTNVQRHSSAQRARVVLRSESSPNGWVEAESPGAGPDNGPDRGPAPGYVLGPDHGPAVVPHLPARVLPAVRTLPVPS